MKTTLHVIVVVITGSLLGTFFAKLVSIWFPQGNVPALINTSINTGLHPTTVDLSILQFTLGLVFQFNMATVAGVFIAALIYKQLVK